MSPLPLGSVLSLPVTWYVASETLSNIVIIGSVHVSRQRSNNPVPCIATTNFII